MKYYWPLVLIGGAILIFGTALPWLRWYGGFPMIGQPTSGFNTGFASGRGVLPAIGGVALLFIALIDKGNAERRGLTLIVSGAGAFLIVFIGWMPSPICGDCPIYSATYGTNVSLLGAALAIVGSLIRLSDADMVLTKIDVAIPVILASFIVCAALALVAYPVLGAWLGLWHTSLPGCQPCLTLSNGASNACAQQNAACYATATAKAIELTPPAWWPLGH